MAAHRAFSPVLFLAVLLMRNLSVSTAAGSDATGFIRSSCDKTRYPDVCYATLVDHAKRIGGNNLERLAWTALYVSREHVMAAATHISDLKAGRSGDVSGAIAEALGDCFSNFEVATRQIRDSMKQMRKVRNNNSIGEETFAFEMSNVKTWMSSALTDEDTCLSGFEGVADGPFKTDVSGKVEEVKKVTSNALALLNLYTDSKN